MKTHRQNQLRQQRQDQHIHCPMRFEKKGPHTGMYCAQHGTWIKWMSQADLAKITAKIS